MSEYYDIEKDLKEAEAMAKALTPYVHENQLYGNVGGGGFFSALKMPSLTLGALLMRLRRLRVLEDSLSAAQRTRLSAAEQRNEDVYKEWRVHYQRKLVKEANSRLDAMSVFFEECMNNPKLCARVYQPEASRRTIVQEIVMAMGEIGMTAEIESGSELRTKMSGTDSRLRRYTEASDFIWANALMPAYPQTQFWWLYQHPHLE